MDVEESIFSVAKEFDSLWNETSAAFDSEDPAAQARVTLSGFKLVQKYERIKVDALALVATFLAPAELISQEERNEALVRGFAIAAKLRAAFHDEMSDVESETKIAGQMDDIAKALDACGKRSALVGLLDDADARVRALAGAYLLSKNLASDRAVPVLRQIANDGQINSAHFVAFAALFRWEREGKSGFES